MNRTQYALAQLDIALVGYLLSPTDSFSERWWQGLVEYWQDRVAELEGWK